MEITPKRLRLALRSPANLLWSVRHVLRHSPLGQLDRLLLRGYSFKPSVLSVNVTDRCNLRCEMCMQPRQALGAGASATVGGVRGELTPVQWRAVVDQAASARPAFYFSGGEPLLYHGLTEVLAHVKSRGMVAALVTNGTALVDHAARLVEAGIDNVTVSLDGPETVHDAIRGVPGTFRRAVEGIRALREAKQRAGAPYPALKINCVITPRSLETLEETVDVARGLGVEELNLQHPIFDTAENVVAHNRVFERALAVEGGEDSAALTQAAPPRSKGFGEYYDMQFSEEQFTRLEAALRRILSRRDPALRILFFPSVQPADWRGYYLDLSHPFPRRCAAPWTMMRLLADGAFEPCLHYVVGNVAETPLWALWNSAGMRRFRRALARRRIYPACARCCYRCY